MQQANPPGSSSQFRESPPSRPSGRGTLVFGIVAAVALGSTVVAFGFGGAAEQRLGAARSKLNGECRDLGRGTSSPCDPNQHAPVLTEANRGRRELAAADAALRTGDGMVAAAELAQVLEGAEAIDRMHTLSASAAAASLFDGVADRIDANPTLLDHPWLAQTVRRTQFMSARHPLATERLTALSRLSRMPGELPLRTGGFAERRATEAMGDVNVALVQMEHAALAKDDAACQKAATSTTGLAAQVTVGPGICSVAERVVASGERLDRLRARATARASLNRSACRRL